MWVGFEKDGATKHVNCQGSLAFFSMGKNTHLYFHKRGVTTFQLPAEKAAQTEKCNGAIKSNNSVFEAF